MTYVAYPNENNIIEYYKIDPNIAGEVYLQRHANSILVETLPDANQDCWEIVGNEVVIGDKLLTKLKNELIAKIKEDIETKKYDNITVGSNTFDINTETLIYLNSAIAPVNWVLVGNSTVELSAQDLSNTIAAISSRATNLVTDGRRKKDLVLAMTTIEQLEAVDIELL